MEAPRPGARQVSLAEAADVLRLPVESVEALVGAGYLSPAPAPPQEAPAGDAELHLALTDLKAFVARNSAEAAADELEDALDRSGLRSAASTETDPATLLDTLDGRSTEMAARAFDVFCGLFPEARSWSAAQRDRFLEHARSRFEAILAIVAAGEAVDELLTGELADVGRAAAASGAPLPEVLLTLRISRDLVVQTAVDAASRPGQNAGLALSLLLTKVLPAIDRLTDAIATGYWEAVVETEEASKARYEAIVEHATDGVFEIDADGVIRYANPALGLILGAPSAELPGASVAAVLALTEPGDVVAELFDRARLDGWTELAIRRTDGVDRLLQVRTHQRRLDDGRWGRGAVVRDVTAERELARQKDDFLALMTHELRTPVTTVLGLGVTLDTYADELSPDRVQRMGRTIHQQADRVARLADDLFDVSRLQSATLMLSPRTVDLRSIAEAAVGILAATRPVESVAVRIPPGLLAHADARRTEQVLAHLVENALVHGAAPVVVEGVDCDVEVELCVSDAGPGLPPGAEDFVFTKLHPSGDTPRYRDRASGLGLSLVRGLVEAMGGRVWYEPAEGGGASFLVTLPAPRSR